MNITIRFGPERRPETKDGRWKIEPRIEKKIVGLPSYGLDTAIEKSGAVRNAEASL